MLLVVELLAKGSDGLEREGNEVLYRRRIEIKVVKEEELGLGLLRGWDRVGQSPGT